MQQNIQYNKTVVTSVILVCFTIFSCFCVYVIGNVKISSNNANVRISNNNARISEANIQSVITRGTDKFTHCLQIVMSEARQNSKPIEAKDARAICIATIGK